MIQLLLVTILFTVAACATSGLAPNPAESVQAPAESVQAKESSGDVLPGGNNPAEIGDGPLEFEEPIASETPDSMMPAKAIPYPPIVCEKVVPTGSILPVKVCRHPIEAARKQEADQKIFDDFKRNTALGNSRL